MREKTKALRGDALLAEMKRVASIPTNEDGLCTDCEKCDGYGYRLNQAGDLVGLCDCKKARAESGRLKRYERTVFEVAPADVRRFEYIDEGRGAIPIARRAWFEANPTSRAIILSGKPGTGKTTAAHYFARLLIRSHRIEARFVCCRNLGLKVARMIENDQARKYVETVNRWVENSNSIVVFDDLGAESHRESGLKWVHDLVEARFRRNALTVFTTNLTIDGLVDRYGDTMITRILSGRRFAFVVDINGKDLRIDPDPSVEDLFGGMI